MAAAGPGAEGRGRAASDQACRMCRPTCFAARAFTRVDWFKGWLGQRWKGPPKVNRRQASGKDRLCLRLCGSCIRIARSSCALTHSAAWTAGRPALALTSNLLCPLSARETSIMGSPQMPASLDTASRGALPCAAGLPSGGRRACARGVPGKNGDSGDVGTHFISIVRNS